MQNQLLHVWFMVASDTPRKMLARTIAPTPLPMSAVPTRCPLGVVRRTSTA